MTSLDSIAEVLHEAAETHHVVWRITDGDDPLGVVGCGLAIRSLRVARPA